MRDVKVPQPWPHDAKWIHMYVLHMQSSTAEIRNTGNSTTQRDRKAQKIASQGFALLFSITLICAKPSIIRQEAPPHYPGKQANQPIAPALVLQQLPHFHYLPAFLCASQLHDIIPLFTRL